MKIFLAGAKSILGLDDAVKAKLFSLQEKGYDLLVGDCTGVDSLVQQFYAETKYHRVTVYASNGKARNNIGMWPVKNVPVPAGIHGFDFYRQKDIAMVRDTDCGFMIWDGKSKGTLNNIVDLVNCGKPIVIYLMPKKKMCVVRDSQDLLALINACEAKTKQIFSRIVNSQPPRYVNECLF